MKWQEKYDAMVVEYVSCGNVKKSAVPVRVTIMP